MAKQQTSRPLSPHLQIYRPEISSMLSISHRISGFFLYFGIMLLSWALIAKAIPDCEMAANFANFTYDFFTKIIGKILLFCWSLAFFYHFCNGIRHLYWDTARGFSIKSVTISGITVIITSIALTIIAWLSGFANIL
jgi:succinate dehydrogenase / fumarate reductase, cytochrome b subunit